MAEVIQDHEPNVCFDAPGRRQSGKNSCMYVKMSHLEWYMPAVAAISILYEFLLLLYDFAAWRNLPRTWDNARHLAGLLILDKKCRHLPRILWIAINGYGMMVKVISYAKSHFLCLWVTTFTIYIQGKLPLAKWFSALCMHRRATGACPCLTRLLLSDPF
jgi:hypothetical protein